MSNRSLNWSAALRTIHADRIQVAPGVLTARTLIQGFGRMRRTSLVASTGAYDRAAIMVAAIEAAKADQTRTGAAWAASMSVGLTAAWIAAKPARSALAY